MGNASLHSSEEIDLCRCLQEWCIILSDAYLPSAPVIVAMYDERLVKYPDVTSFLTKHSLGRYMTKKGIIPLSSSLIVAFQSRKAIIFTIIDREGAFVPGKVWIKKN